MITNVNVENIPPNKVAILTSLGLILQGTSAMELIQDMVSDAYNPLESLKKDAELVKANKQFVENFTSYLPDGKTIDTEKVAEIFSKSAELKTMILSFLQE